MLLFVLLFVILFIIHSHKINYKSIYNNINVNFSVLKDVLIEDSKEFIQYFYSFRELTFQNVKKWIHDLKEFIQYFYKPIQDFDFYVYLIKDFYELGIQNVKELWIQYGEIPLLEFPPPVIFGLLYLFIYYIYYRYNHDASSKFSFLAFVFSIVKQILLLFIVTLCIYMVNIQDFLTIYDDKSLQYLCALIGFIFIILVYVKKIQKYGLKKTLFNSFLLISSFYLLRLNLIYYIPLILPLTFNQLALNVLTSRLNLIVYITEDILNLKIWSSVQDILLDSYKTIKTYFSKNNVFWDLFYAAIPISTVYAQEPDDDLEMRDQNILKEKAIVTFDVEYRPLKRKLRNMDFNLQELILLKHAIFMKENPNLVVMVSPTGKENEFFPIKLEHLIFDLRGTKPLLYPPINGVDNYKYNIALFKHITVNDIIVKENDELKTVLIMDHFCCRDYTGDALNKPIRFRDIYVLERYWAYPIMDKLQLDTKFHLRCWPTKQSSHTYEAYKHDINDLRDKSELCIQESKYDKLVVPLGIFFPHKPSIVAELGYTNPNCTNHIYVPKVQYWHEQYIIAQFNNNQISHAEYSIKMQKLVNWKGDNDVDLDQMIKQQHKYKFIQPGTSAAEANQIISRWRSQ